MMSTSNYSQPKEEELSQECKDLISTLPREKGWFAPHIYLYQNFWYIPSHLQAIISCRRNFRAKDSDVLLATNPKSGTTWLKAILFALLNRERHRIGDSCHPLLTSNPHDLVLSLEVSVYATGQAADVAAFPSPRLFSTHIPYSSLPESSKNCKIVYVCREPKDVFVSLWHFMNKLIPVEKDFREAFENFCQGSLPFGPFWDHALEYWRRSREDPDRVLFVKYEDMKGQPAVVLRRMAEFLGCGFSAEEEEAGKEEQIVELCSFENMSGLEVNKKGVLPVGMENSAFFRRGVVGDWKCHLTAEMAEKIDRITAEKFFGSGLVL